MSEEPHWVTADHAQCLHDRAISTSKGAAGLRDRDLLESAVARPQNLYAYEQVTDPLELAASYAQGIAQNHAFADGNKRTGFLTADLFLSLNGYSLDASPKERHADQMVQLAEGQISREQFAEHLREHTTRLEIDRDRDAFERTDRVREFRERMRTPKDHGQDRER